MGNIIIPGANTSKPSDSGDPKLEQQIKLILMKAGVTEPEIEQCLEWAFGPGFWYVNISPDWLDRWNKLHPKKFKVRPNDSFVEFMYVVGNSFCQARDKAAMDYKITGKAGEIPRE